LTFLRYARTMSEVPVLRLDASLVQPADWLTLLPAWLSRVLPEFLPRQRWFAGKGRELHQVTVADTALLTIPHTNDDTNHDTNHAWPWYALALVRVTYREDVIEHYLLPVGLDREAPAETATLAVLRPAVAVAPVGATAPPAHPYLFEATADGRFLKALLTAMRTGTDLRSTLGRVVFTMSGDVKAEVAAVCDAGAARAPGAEQSNSSALFLAADGQPRFFLKLFRKLEPGVNPEAEVLRFLGDFPHVPRLAATAAYEGVTEAALAVVQRFVASQGDGWQYTLAALTANPQDATDERPQRLLQELALLGRRTAQLHRALAARPEVDDFAPLPITAQDTAGWQAEIRELARSVGRELAAAAAGLPAAMRPNALAVAVRLEGELPGLEALSTLVRAVEKIRIHGDFHLGQVLKTADDWVIFDFEGEPVRPLSFRRSRFCALRDVAGMLRSFSYATHVAGRAAKPTHPAGASAAWLRAWEQSARDAFWNAYQTEAGNDNAKTANLLPSQAGERAAVLACFELEKAIYELRYELRNRPDWLTIPLAAVERLLQG
ncbi:MAG: maltokinase N-terminal cap-like domain-containing protein, partial [Terriglobales bacterium]